MKADREAFGVFQRLSPGISGRQNMRFSADLPFRALVTGYRAVSYKREQKPGILPGIGGTTDRVSNMLIDTEIRKAKARDKAYKITDGNGLHLYISKSGAKLWRYRYEINGREKLLSLGAYPDVSLANARKARDEAREELRKGNDPSLIKRVQRLTRAAELATTFEAVAREWLDLRRADWSEKYAEGVERRLEIHAFPRIGSLALTDIHTRDLFALIRPIEARTKQTARKLRQHISHVYTHAIATGRAKSDPAATLVQGMAAVRYGQRAAVTTLDDARSLLRAVEAMPAFPITKLAHRLLALTALRPEALLGARWSEFEADQWTIPPWRMKLRKHLKSDETRAHIVPLSRQAVEVIDGLREISSDSTLVFPNHRNDGAVMSHNAILYLLYRAGYHRRHTAHGWRSTFSTVMNESFPDDRFIIDFMLAHIPRGTVERAYNRAMYLQRRRELAQEWADMLIKEQKTVAEIINLC